MPSINSFSVIIPIFNGARTIVKTLESIYESINFFYKAYPDSNQVTSEIILVNDKSTDNTLKCLEHFRNSVKDRDYGFKIINHPTNQGPGAARNTGVKHAQGDILFFCDADDFFLIEHVFVCFMVLSYPDFGNIESSDLKDLQEDLSACLFFSTPTHSYSLHLPQEKVHAVRTGVKLQDAIHPYWKSTLENSLTQNLCIRKQCHEFIEGFPENLEYVQLGLHEDLSYSLLLHNFFKVFKIQLETVEYMRYPGNALDRSLKKFQVAPGEYPELMTSEHQLLIAQIAKIYEQKLSYLRKKQQQYELPNELPSFSSFSENLSSPGAS